MEYPYLIWTKHILTQNKTMEAINVESSIDVSLSNVTASSREGDFYAEAKTYLTYRIGKCTYLLTVFVFQA